MRSFLLGAVRSAILLFAGWTSRDGVGRCRDRRPRCSWRPMTKLVSHSIKFFDCEWKKGERTAAHTSWVVNCSRRQSEGSDLPDLARGYLMLRRARLGPKREAILLAAASQSYAEQSIAQALRVIISHSLDTTRVMARLKERTAVVRRRRTG